MKDFITCGTLKVGLGFSDIVCDPSTGDLIFCDDINGNCIMSSMSITDPMNMENNSAALERLVADANADGVILSETYLIVLKDFVAEYRAYGDNTKVVHRVEFDLDIVYDGEIN